AFMSYARNLTPMGNGPGYSSNIFVFDRMSGTTIRASVAVGGGEPDRSSFNPVISADGRWVAYESDALNLVPNGANNGYQIYLFDRVNGKTRLVSQGIGGARWDGTSSHASISANGRFVAFSSIARNLVAPFGNDAQRNIFVFDRGTGQIALISAELP